MSALNLGGYLVAFVAVCVYNYQKLQAMQSASKSKDAATVQPGRRKDEEVVRTLRTLAQGLGFKLRSIKHEPCVRLLACRTP